MVSPQAFDKMLTELNVTSYQGVDASSAVDVAWVDMRDYDRILIQATATELTGVGITALRILANAESDGSGTDVVIVAHAVGTAPDAVGDSLVLECSAEQIVQEGEDNSLDLRYVSVNMTAANSNDRILTTYIRKPGRYAFDALTADSIA